MVILKNKSANAYAFALQYTKRISNYFLSTWIANLGVVPLFLSAAFLFLPLFLIFAFLFVFVLMVLEPILNLLNFIIVSYISQIFLQGLKPNVKVLMQITALCTALSANAYPFETRDENIIISKGEQHELNIGIFEKFSIGNKEIISHKHIPSSNKFLIKGKKIGFSDLVFWKENSKTKDKIKINYRIYVISKQAQLKIAKLAEVLKSTGLEVSINGTMIVATGTIDTLGQYRLIKKVQKENEKHILLNSHLSSQLRNNLIATIYQKIFANTESEVSCHSEYSNIICNYHNVEKESLNIINDLQERYFINFISVSPKNKKRNYVAKLKIIQMEKLDGTEMSFGLNKLYASVEDVFKNGVQSLISKNMIFLENNHVDVSTLAEPETVININSPAVIEMGSNIPYQTTSENNAPSTSWHFAGLKVTMNLKIDGTKMTVDYETEITRPDNTYISGNKEKSSLNIEIGKPVRLFQICFQTEGKRKDNLPILGAIPLLGNLFSSKSSHRNYKKITGFIILETT